MIKVVINLFGRGQMVGFRYSTLRKAREFNIKGSIKDLRDGTVEIEAEGEEAQIEKFIEWCKVGPPYAIIKKIIVEEVETIVTDDKFNIL